MGSAGEADPDDLTSDEIKSEYFIQFVQNQNTFLLIVVLNTKN